MTMKEFLKNNWFGILVTVAVIVLIMLFSRSCNNNQYLKDELARYENNLKAANDSLKNYKDGKYQCAEMRALQLRVDELNDSLKLERGKEPVTIIKYVAGITDTVYVNGDIIHDTVNIGNLCDRGVIAFHKENTFGKSSRLVDATVPYTIDSSCNINVGESTIALNQNIWIDANIYKNKKGETFLNLKTDYPNTTFNSGTAIVVTDGATNEKKKHFGVCFGATVGYGITINNNGALTARPAPYIGLGATIGWQPNKLKF